MTKLRIVIDLESRSKVDLKTAGAYKYARDPSTSILCFGYKIGDGPKYIWFPERAAMPTPLWEAMKSGALLVAHNAGFERMMLKYCLVRYPLLTRAQRAFVSSLTPSNWRCTMAKAAYSSMPVKLENACVASGIETQKDKEGHRLMLKYAKPRKPSKHNPKVWWDDKEELRKIYRYCLTDVQAEYELDNAIPDLPETEQEIWELNEEINERGILIDVETVGTILDMIDEEQERIRKRVHKLSNGTIEKITQTAKVLEWVNARGADMANLQAATIRDTLERKHLPRDVRRMLEYRQAGSKTSTAKYTAMLKAVDRDNRARGLLRYAGAQPTLRFSGQRLQPQNFPRVSASLIKAGFNSNEAIELIKSGGAEAIRKRYGDSSVMDVLSSCVRGMFIPSPGCEFFDADLAGVEARLAFSFAYHDEGVQAFKDGRKLYEEMAAEAFGCDIEWLLTKEGKESIERFVGKESILGCQYGLGPDKFMSQCHKKGVKQVTKEIAKKAVYAYREKHWPVPEAWANLERNIVEAIRNPGHIYKTNRVEIYCTKKNLIIVLPTGRKMRYPSPKIKKVRDRWGRLKSEITYMAWDWGLNPETGKKRKMWKRITSWGGIFFNHIVQGFARELMVRGIKRINNTHYRFLLSFHDEALSECKIGEGSVEEYVNLLIGDLSEFEGLNGLIKAEGWKGPRYKK